MHLSKLEREERGVRSGSHGPLELKIHQLHMYHMAENRKECDFHRKMGMLLPK